MKKHCDKRRKVAILYKKGDLALLRDGSTRSPCVDWLQRYHSTMQGIALAECSVTVMGMNDVVDVDRQDLVDVLES